MPIIAIICALQRLKNSYPINYILLFVFTALESITLGACGRKGRKLTTGRRRPAAFAALAAIAALAALATFGAFGAFGALGCTPKLGDPKQP